MRKDMFKILGETPRVTPRGQQRQDRIEDCFWRDRNPVPCRKPSNKARMDIRTMKQRTVVIQWKCVTTICAPKSVIVRHHVVTPRSGALAYAARHGIKTHIIVAPNLLKLWP
jgi:hypothetical protein